MFAFDFAARNRAAAADPTDTGAAGAAAGCGRLPAEEIVETEEAEAVVTEELVAVSPQVTLLKGMITTARAAALLGQADVADSDLIAGSYEGGFKLWEGGLDLAAFLADDASLGGAQAAMLGMSVLELGCGHGLPGLVALLAGATVHFQDYNKEVLQALTMPNVAANWRAHCVRLAAARGPPPPPVPCVRYFSGDWLSLTQLLPCLNLQGMYDMVLSAETIYSLPAMSALYGCIKQCLKRPTGVAYIASKTFYFGVASGGGVAAFLGLVRQDGAMQGSIVKTINDGVSNKRVVIKLCWS